jgi:hypothetical protein
MAGFIASLTPRTLAWSAATAAVVLLLQAGIIAGVMLNERAETGSYQTASAPGAMAAGSYVMARFAAQASANEVTEFLETNKLSVAGGPAPGGLYRLRVSDAKLTKEQVAGIARRLQQDKRIDLIVPTE